MPRVVGIDPGTVTIDVCGLADGQLYLDKSWPTPDILGDPTALIQLLTGSGAPDLIAGPSGYGLPLRQAREATEEDLRLAFLAPPEESGGIGGLRGLARQLGGSGLPVVYTPGVVHLDTVPQHRKLNRVDMGTAEKLCAAALGIHLECERRGCSPDQASFILVELGGGFTAALGIERGQVVDGIGGTSGPLGWRAAGALDGEVAYLAGTISKAALFQGGVGTFLDRNPHQTSLAMEAYLEGAIKAIKQLRCTAPSADTILLSGRKAVDEIVIQRIAEGVADIGPVRRLHGFARIAKEGAQGAALIADGLVGGRHRQLVERLRLRHARGTVLDHLVFLSPQAARRRLGLE
jgi:predicted butyrate kinase (DUF1464 family)